MTSCIYSATHVTSYDFLKLVNLFVVCWSGRMSHCYISGQSRIKQFIFASQVPNKEQVNALSKELQSRATVPGFVPHLHVKSCLSILFCEKFDLQN